MSVFHYKDAQKLAQKEFRSCTSKGQYPYLLSLEEFVPIERINQGISLGTILPDKWNMAHDAGDMLIFYGFKVVKYLFGISLVTYPVINYSPIGNLRDFQMKRNRRN